MGAKEDAFLDAFQTHSPALFRHAFFRIGDRDRALELTQDAFMKAWDYVRAGGEVRTPKSFLYRVINNLIVDEYRRTKTQSLDAMVEAEGSAAEALFAEGSLWEVEETADTAVMVGKVREAVKELPESYRTAVTMRFMDGLSPKEIAKMLNCTENVVSVRIHRAVIRLRQMLSHA